MSQRIKLIVGLGNPGVEHESTRHNAGQWFVDALTSTFPTVLRKESKFQAMIASVNIDQHDCWLLIPTTYMNLSGQSVASFMRFYKIAPSQILVAHDELDLPVGTVKIKESGGHGGHNGLRDIIAHLDTEEFYRLRIGIQHPGHKDLVTDYVLQKPSREDHEKIMGSIREAIDVLPDIISGDFQKAMKALHTNKDKNEN